MARPVSGGAPPPSRAPEDHFKPLRRNEDPPLSVGASAPPPVQLRPTAAHNARTIRATLDVSGPY